eukprot:9894029-Karenia_brevis.AAC.1
MAQAARHMCSLAQGMNDEEVVNLANSHPEITGQLVATLGSRLAGSSFSTELPASVANLQE